MRASELRALPVGTRLVVRYRLHGEAHGATDALGELVRVGAAECILRTRRGEVVIAIADIVAAKRVPPPPAPRPRPGSRRGSTRAGTAPTSRGSSTRCRRCPG